MAANPLITCGPATSWYDFTYTLAWSNECEVAELLSDIPFISVGVLVFGVSALFFIVKKVSLSAVWLFISALLAFVAAVLDLGRTLADGAAMNTAFIASKPIIRTREVLLASSIGFRFLFYWSYIAEPPRRDLSAVSIPTTRNDKVFTLEYMHGPCNGSWVRWGLPGKLLGVGLLMAIMVITALQIVWRVAPQFHQYGNVYAADAALELLVSFMLLLKLLLNTLTLNSPDTMSVHTFKECLAPICALLVNIAIGVGNLLCFAFTESTVGRLLQASEVCIIVVFVVVTAFLRHQDILSAISPQAGKHRDVAFTLPEPSRRSTFRITPPLIVTPRMSMILGAAMKDKESSRSEWLRRSTHRSLNHVSSWVSSRISRNRARCEDEVVRLWNAEKVGVDLLYTGGTDMEQARSSVSSVQGPKNSGGLLRDLPANTHHTSVISTWDTQPAFTRSMEGPIHSCQASCLSQADALQLSTPLQVPVSSVPPPTNYGVEHAGGIAAAPEASPVYSLSSMQPLASASDSRTSLNELLRQQSQLEQSIEALRLFSARMSTNSSHSDTVTSTKAVELGRSDSIGQRTVASEVSLSSFPIPPWLTTPVPSLPSRPSSVKRIRGNRRAHLATGPTPLQDAYASASPSISTVVDVPSPPRHNSIPQSPLGEGNEASSTEAEKSFCSNVRGTQYNVTSFIGGLATPCEHRHGSQEKLWWSAESDSSIEAVQNNVGVEKLPPHMLPAPRRFERLPASPAVAKPLPVARFSRLTQGNAVNEPANVVQYRTNEQTSRAVVPPSHTSMDHREKGVGIQSATPRPVREADSSIGVPAERADRAQRTFVRPRPPPLAIRSYREQNPDLLQIQVLVDD